MKTINLSNLFEMQAALDTHIILEKKLEDIRLLPKKILALLVELGELANEWRGFKFWSNDQEPRVKVPATAGGEPYKNPLLEEYVDCLHFVLSFGNDMFEAGHDFNLSEIIDISETIDEAITTEDTFRVLFAYASELHLENPNAYESLLTILLNLGYQLGFTQEQIEQAYIKKNEINHQRQLSGY